MVDFEVLTGVLGVEARVMPDLRLTAALKYEDYSSTGSSRVNYVSTLVNQTTGVVASTPLTTNNKSSISEEAWVPELEFRYTGLKNFAFYGTIDYRDSPGDEMTRYEGITPSPGGPVVPAAPIVSSNTVAETQYNFTVGGKWDLSREIALRGEVFSKTRYVYQQGKAAVAADGYLKGDSNDAERHSIGETVNWNPNKLFYMQLNLNIVLTPSGPPIPPAARPTTFCRIPTTTSGTAVSSPASRSTRPPTPS